ncbi:MAG: single-stranded-DNA-specific exonuclease RecJ [Gaiellaceae bacterium]
MQQGSWTIEPVGTREVRRLANELELSELTASVLARRGLAEPERARAFLAAEAPGHDAFALGDMAQAVQRIRAAVAAGEKICVHGDYDVDGVAATALAVILLKELGAEVSWALPSRFDEGYGLTPGMLERLADDGCSLVLTVDCGITAIDEVAQAAELGLDVIVTDHHRPGERLPACPIVAPRPADYPFAGLCGAGVVYKLGEALFGADSEFLRDQLDLVCLATVADVVPLADENRWLVAAGLKRLGRTTRPGLRALMRSAGVDAATIDTGQIAFRLAPRINAAGRLGHPDLALELLLGEDEEEASRQTRRLEELNRERQVIEDGILRDAIGQVESWPESKRSRRAYVISGEDWNEGVIGIVASRLVERFSRPVVLVAGSGGDWKGSGRSIPAFDLHGGIVACSSLLERFGGHRAAAGFSIRPEHLDEFIEAFTTYASELLSDSDLVSVTKVDAIVPPQAKLTLELCQELERLAPFGMGNPGVLLIAPGCELSDLTSCGDGKHLRFRVRLDGCDAGSAIAFGMGKQLDRLRRIGRYDVVFRLEANRWNGTVTPQLQVRRIFDAAPGYEALRDRLAAQWRGGEAGWDEQTRAIFSEAGLLEEDAGRRSLLESETFRTLLAEKEPVAAAA